MNRSYFAGIRLAGGQASLPLRASRRSGMAASVFCAVLALLLLSGCGTPGAPGPPSLNLPAAVDDLTASRIGNAVHLTWTMPERTTDRLLLKHPVDTTLCRAIESGPCSVIATLALPPGKPATYTDVLDSNLTDGPNRLLTYQVSLRNHAKKSAGTSNSVFTASGTAPATMTGLTAQVRRDGVMLSWHPATQPQSAIAFRIERVLVAPPASTGAQAKSPIAATRQPVTQILTVQTKNDVDPGRALDHDAQMDQKYRYTVSRVAALHIGNHDIQIQGQPSDPLFVTTTNVFPPSVPQNLEAVADTDAGAIDLSWSPVSDPDLAGYYVYRRDTQGGLPAQRISSTKVPIPSPSFRDTGAARGHTYAYSVSAVSHDGYESAPSRETIETLPAK